MAEINHLVITINREYGAGGRSVAKGLAENLKLSWYDYDFIQKAAEKSGISEEEIRQEEEVLSSTDIWIERLFSDNLLYNGRHEKVFQAEKQAVIDLAQRPCIIVGRLANAICRAAYIPTFDIFLYADLKEKTQRAIELNEYKAGASPEKYVEKMDAYRRNYYKHYTGHEFNDPQEYDICMKTSRLGIDHTVEFLTDLIKAEDKKEENK